MKNEPTDACPCGSGHPARECCLPFIEQSRLPATAEQLMRSRYTAFTLNDEAWLRYSWHPEHCPPTIYLDSDCHWLGLKIIRTSGGQADDDTGEVEFVARYKKHGKATRIHENSRFTRYQGRWVYQTGSTPRTGTS
jgi:SEC-C motif domain protein